jgi:hypothetical protein
MVLHIRIYCSVKAICQRLITHAQILFILIELVALSKASPLIFDVPLTQKLFQVDVFLDFQLLLPLLFF